MCDQDRTTDDAYLRGLDDHSTTNPSPCKKPFYVVVQNKE